ncbi:MAG: DegT/DnrJ/EryC1/StrS family aminotransferase [Desulfomonilaceae bacterium]
MIWKVPLSDISFGPEEKEAVQRVLQSGWVSMGPETELFEAEFAAYIGAKHAVAVSSCTAALHLSLLALGIGPGDEVIVPSLTFVATANAVLYVGATPVFADITSVDDWNISPHEIEERITPRTKAVAVLHYAGFPCQMGRIRAIAERHGLRVVEDAAHAHGSTFKSKKLGAWGDTGCFSFFANKNMTCGEGGMVVTDSDEAAKRLKILRSHGMTTLTWDRHRGHSFSYDVIETGYNYRMDEIRAALARVQLSKLDANNQKRREITRGMRNDLQELGSVSLPFCHHNLDDCSSHIFPILLESPELRPAFMSCMKESGIQTSIHYPPIHKFSAYKHFHISDLPVTESVTGREVTLPLFPSITPDQKEAVVRAVEAGLGNESTSL